MQYQAQQKAQRFIGEGTALNDLQSWHFESNIEAQEVCWDLTTLLKVDPILVVFSGKPITCCGVYRYRRRIIELHAHGENLGTLTHEIAHAFARNHGPEFKWQLARVAYLARLYLTEPSLKESARAQRSVS
jgi:hypothetical protein